MNKQIIKTIKSCTSIEELKKIANNHGYSLTNEEAKNYFALFHKIGKVDEEELDHIGGGACYSTEPHGKLIVVPGFNSCKGFQYPVIHDKNDHDCGNCKFKEKGPGATYYCTLRTRYKDDYK